jgi:CRISPR-associated protein Csm3
MRCSLERLQGRSGRGHGDMITFGPCDDPKLATVQLFGTESAQLGEAADDRAGKRPDDEKEAQRTAVIPSRLLVRDALLTGKSREQLKPLRGDLPMTETKTEVCIDRVTSAANPRTFERVPAGAVFAFEMVLEVRALPGPTGTGDARDKVLAILAKDRHEGNHWGRDEDVRWLLTGLDLLQDDALGGQGSRGYGRVKIALDPPKRRTRDDYQEGRDESEWALTGDLKQHFDALNKRGEDERKQIDASLPGAAA